MHIKDVVQLILFYAFSCVMGIIFLLFMNRIYTEIQSNNSEFVKGILYTIIFVPIVILIYYAIFERFVI